MQELYFHVGLAKNASTFLQERFFPKLKNIHYTPTNIYRFYPSIIKKNKHSKYLFSREFDRQFYSEVQKISQVSQNAKIIIVLRPHDEWIASQYRRYVKNGGKQNFSQFLDLNNDKGHWKQKDAYFAPMLQYLGENFNQAPLILFYNDLKNDSEAFLSRIASYLGAEFNFSDIDRSKKHSSYSEKQLYYVQQYGPFNKDKAKPIKNRILAWLDYRSKWLVNHLILYVANLLPDPQTKLIDNAQKEKINNFYSNDWDECLRIAESFHNQTKTL